MHGPDNEANPYAPPTGPRSGLDELAPSTPGWVTCPWCAEPIRFRRVYLPLTSWIRCPHCQQKSKRRKRGVPTGVTELVLLVIQFGLPILLLAVTGSQEIGIGVFVLLYPITVVADYWIDRRISYLSQY
ncbi:hypothetical protein SH528x_005538 [Novipirellula sp. SH528]|uniref:hypothetical protein n=1 Tax=Novipirellula sp. SH528 TaxID=3454466 RepID=UPI003F9F01AB